MSRLTERFSNGQAAVKGCGSNCIHDFQYCDKNENCPTLEAIYEKLAVYEDNEEKEKVCCVSDVDMPREEYQKRLVDAEYRANKAESDCAMLKECIVRMALGRWGVLND